MESARRANSRTGSVSDSDVEKKDHITELKVVESWLKTNAGMAKMTIKRYQRYKRQSLGEYTLQRTPLRLIKKMSKIKTELVTTSTGERSRDF